MKVGLLFKPGGPLLFYVKTGPGCYTGVPVVESLDSADCKFELSLYHYINFINFSTLSTKTGRSLRNDPFNIIYQIYLVQQSHLNRILHLLQQLHRCITDLAIEVKYHIPYFIICFQVLAKDVDLVVC